MEEKNLYHLCFTCGLTQLIRCRAFEIYEWRFANDVPGTAEQDWLEAEKEMLEKIKFL